MTVLEFNYQITTFQEKLIAFAHSLTRSEEDAKDLFQDTILKALRYKDKFVNPTSLKSWLFTIMKNTFINGYRRKKLVSIVNDESVSSYWLNNEESSLPTQTEELYASEIQDAIDSLPEEYRIPFSKYVEGYKYKEIGEELNLPIGTVKSRIFVSRQRLMNQLEEFRV